MLVIRSLAFNILFFSWTILYLIVLAPFAGWWIRDERMRRAARTWIRGVQFLLRTVVGRSTRSCDRNGSSRDR